MACESTSIIEPFQTEQKTVFEFNGGLNSSFGQGVLDIEGKAKIVQIGTDKYSLDVQIRINSKTNEETEQGSIAFRYGFESTTGIITAGNYLVEEQNPGVIVAQGQYNLRKSENSFARYSFTGQKFLLKIDASDNEHIRGNFTIFLQQKSGERMMDGQLENVELKSPLAAMGKFDLNVERMN